MHLDDFSFIGNYVLEIIKSCALNWHTTYCNEVKLNVYPHKCPGKLGEQIMLVNSKSQLNVLNDKIFECFEHTSIFLT